ncbi:bacterioferritin [Telmatospirillum sp.]|uniref:bacterioferritin n=1 Tax=Telmatospirillum sp. TaxID=2079197 RepID=UPI00284AB904|nr:bacterioferritin [Telmatospirillum sp.]MDR3436732.1 bacterioferritin [Telmatospirillum sp.]
MQGVTAVISELNKLLTGELTAADQYFLHSRMYENWGLAKLYHRAEHERVEELEHASLLIHRILFLEGLPDVAARSALNPGNTVPEMLRADLAYEMQVIANLKAAIAVSEKEQDYETRRLLVKLLEDTEEDHTYWLEQQLGLIDKIGLANYLQSAVGPDLGAA